MTSKTQKDPNSSISQHIQLPDCGEILIKSATLNQNLEPPCGRIIAVDGLSKPVVDATAKNLNNYIIHYDLKSNQANDTRVGVLLKNRLFSSDSPEQLLEDWDKVTQPLLPPSFNVGNSTSSQSLLNRPPERIVSVVSFSPIVSLLRTFSLMKIHDVRSGDLVWANLITRWQGKIQPDITIIILDHNSPRNHVVHMDGVREGTVLVAWINQQGNALLAPLEEEIHFKIGQWLETL